MKMHRKMIYDQTKRKIDFLASRSVQYSLGGTVT